MWTQRLYCTVAQYSRSSNVRRRTAILQRIAVHIGLVSLSSRNELGDKRNAGHIKLQDNLDLREGRGSQTRRTRAPARPAFPPLPLGIGIMASKLLGARVWPIHVDQPNLNAVASDENRPTHARVNANPIPLRGCLCCCCWGPSFYRPQLRTRTRTGTTAAAAAWRVWTATRRTAYLCVSRWPGVELHAADCSYQ